MFVGALAATGLSAGRPNPVAGFKGSKTGLDRSFNAVNTALSNPARLRQEALAGLHSGSAVVRFASVYALSLTAVPGPSLQALRPFASSSSVDERMMAASSLVARGDRTGLPALVSALGSGATLGYLDTPEPVWQFARFVLLSFTSGDFGLRRAKTVAAARRTEAAWARAVHNGLKLRPALTASSARKAAAHGALQAGNVGTQVDVAGDTATLTIPVDIYGTGNSRIEDPDTGKAVSLVQYWQDGANAIWDKALADFKYKSSCGSYKLKVNLELFRISKGESGTAGHHQVHFYADPGMRSKIFDPEDGGNHNADDTGPYDQALTGKLGEADENTVAHESGHLMGLGDDYDDVLDENGGAIGSTRHPGRGETIMRNSRLENVDQALVDRLGKLLEKAGKLPACWTGTIESDSQRIYVYPDGTGAQCNDHWHGDLSFMVKPEGAVTGTGTMTLTSGPTCSGRIDPALLAHIREYDFSVSGNKRKAGFTLVLGFVAYSPQPAASYAGITTLISTGVDETGPPLTIPNTAPCKAGGPVATSYTLISDTFTASSVFALKCKSS